MTELFENNTDSLLRRATLQWRCRSLLPYVLLGVTVFGIAAFGVYFWGLPTSIPAVNTVFVAVALLADRQWRLPKPQLCAVLDARYPQLQDSCRLLLSKTELVSPIAALQRQRTVLALQNLLASRESRSFRPPYLRSPLLAAIGACLGLLAFLAMDLQQPGPVISQDENAVDIRDGLPEAAAAIIEAETLVEPPSYTGLTASTQTLQVQAPENSFIRWNVTLGAPVQALHMVAAEKIFAFTSLEPLPSKHWQLTRTLTASDFYQLAITPTLSAQQALLPPLYNIDITTDRAPEFAFDVPSDNVTVVSLEENARSSLYEVRVTVRDDFAVMDTDLLLTLASGSGENVRFRNERIKLQPHGSTKQEKHFRFTIPVARYDIEPGDELYWHLEASDNRAPRANVTKSQHYILRWPQEEIFGLSDTEGMAIKVLPEYFRSQRQLIIDTEALLQAQPDITEQEFRKRSASLAYEQNLLRMRYGRFLGEEDSTLEEAGHDEHGSGEAELAHDGEDDSGHGHYGSEHPSQPLGEVSQQFGDAAGVVAAAGHQHDSSDHATLFDPKTKELLRGALNAMWSSWRDLSVVEPRASLPYQHTALRYIKEVQQASRIYLQRVGFETPPLDESRRLSGDHEPPTLPNVESSRDDSERRQLLSLLHRVQRGELIEVQEEQSLRQLQTLEHDSALQMALAKELRRYQQQPDCADCRRQLSALLYGLIPTPSARPTLPRTRPLEGDYSNWLQQTPEVTQ